jgi:hypothetical protein
MVSCLFFVLTSIATYPLIFHMGTLTAGIGTDSRQNIWNLWWGFNFFSYGQSTPFYTTCLYYPTGVSLAYHPLGMTNIISGYALRIFTSNINLIYNLNVVFSYIFTGVCTFWLVRKITENSTASILSSVIFTFSAYRINRTFSGQSEVIATQYIVLVLICFLFWKRNWDKKHAFLTGICIGIVAWNSMYQLLGLIILFIILWLYEFIKQILSKQALFPFLIGTAILGIVALIIASPLIVEAVKYQDEFQSISDQTYASMLNSVDPTNFLLPTTITPPSWLMKIPNALDMLWTFYDKYSPLSVRPVYIGITVFIIIFCGFFSVRDKKLLKILLLSAFFATLCLGPTLTILGHPITQKTPYQLINSLPFLGLSRTPFHFQLFVMLGMAIACGLIVTNWMKRGKFKSWMALVLAIFVFLENLVLPFWTENLSKLVSPFDEIIAKDPDMTNAVLDIPIDLYGAQGPADDYMYLQTIHQHPIVGGYIARTPEDRSTEINNSPFLFELRARMYDDQAPYKFSDDEISVAIKNLCQIHPRYIIVHKDYLGEDNYSLINSTVEIVLGKSSYSDEKISAWIFDSYQLCH